MKPLALVLVAALVAPGSLVAAAQPSEHPPSSETSPADPALNGDHDAADSAAAALPRTYLPKRSAFELRPLLGVIIVSAAVVLGAVLYVIVVHQQEAIDLDRRPGRRRQ